MRPLQLLLAALAAGALGCTSDFCAQMQGFAQKNAGCGLAAASEPANCEGQLAGCSAADQARLDEFARCVNAVPTCLPSTESSFEAQVTSCASNLAGLGPGCGLGGSSGSGSSGSGSSGSGSSGSGSSGTTTSGSSGGSCTAAGGSCLVSSECCNGVCSGGRCVAGTTSSGGTTSGSSSSSSSSSSSGTVTSKTYCDGVGLSAAGETIYAQTYWFEAGLKAGGCFPTIMGSAAGGGWTDGTSVSAASGILDYDVEDNGGAGPSAHAALVIFAAGCEDFGLPQNGETIDGNGAASFPPPANGQTVASVVSSQAVTGAVYGVVTAVEPWALATATAAAKHGAFYLQDPGSGLAEPGSGILVFVPASVVSATVPAAAAPNRGDVVALTGFTWSPYNGSTASSPGYVNSQNQLQAGAAASLQVIGTAPLPPPVPLAIGNLVPTGTSQYLGMRVSSADGPFTVAGSGPSNSCPASIADVVAPGG